MLVHDAEKLLACMQIECLLLLLKESFTGTNIANSINRRLLYYYPSYHIYVGYLRLYT